MERFRKSYGLGSQQREVEKTQPCPRCEFVNEPSSEVCEKCGTALSLQKAQELQGQNVRFQEEITNLKSELAGINSFMNNLLAKDPALVDVLSSRARQIRR